MLQGGIRNGPMVLLQLLLEHLAFQFQIFAHPPIFLGTLLRLSLLDLTPKELLRYTHTHAPHLTIEVNEYITIQYASLEYGSQRLD